MEGGGEKPAPLYEQIFETQLTICAEFHISPFQLRRERFSEFCLLVKRLKKQSKRTESKVNLKTTDGKPQRKMIPVTDYKEPKKRGGEMNGR